SPEGAGVAAFPGDAKDAARMRPVSSTALRADRGSDLNFIRRSLPLKSARVPILTTMLWRWRGPIKRPIALKKRQAKPIGVDFPFLPLRRNGSGPRSFCQLGRAAGGWSMKRVLLSLLVIGAIF